MSTPEHPQPKWGPFERAPEESTRKAKAQIKAVREQTQQSSNGRSYADEEPREQSTELSPEVGE